MITIILTLFSMLGFGIGCLCMSRIKGEEDENSKH